MDICEIKPVEREIEIVHPKSGEPLGIKVTVLSLNDPKMASLKRRIINQRLDLERRGKTFKADDIEENNVSLLIAAMVDWKWEGESTFMGEKPEFNEKNIKAVFKAIPWFKNQISEAVGDEESFFLK